MLCNVVCKTFKDVERLSLRDLNTFCENFGVDIELPRSAKINALCHCLGISTTGTDSIVTYFPRISDSLTEIQKKEFEVLTPAAVYAINDWSSNLAKVPAIDDNDVSGVNSDPADPAMRGGPRA